MEVNESKLSEYDNEFLLEIVSDSNSHSEELLMLTYFELKKRNINISQDIQRNLNKSVYDKEDSIGKNQKIFENIHDEKLFQKAVLEQDKDAGNSEEKRLKIEKQRQLLIGLQKEEQTKKAKRSILFGGMWFVGGCAVTFISLNNEYGGVIAYGAIVFGGIQLIKGFIEYNS